jgi:hypothetical protein
VRISKRIVKRIGMLLVAILIGIQFVPVECTNPPVASDVVAPPDVHAVLRRACYDCHSNETHWPWYSRVAPASWLVARDVRKGRAEMNFSTWDQIPERRRAKLMHEVGEETAKGEMPPWFYLPAHPKARLTPQDVAVLQSWAPASEAGEHDDRSSGH